MMQPVNSAEKLDALVGKVEDLLAQLPESLDPAIAALRDKVDDGIFDAWTAISQQRAKSEQLAAKGAPFKVAAFFGTAILLAYVARLLAQRHVKPTRLRR